MCSCQLHFHSFLLFITQGSFEMGNPILLLCLVAISSLSLALAFEPSPLQDFCIADTTAMGIAFLHNFILFYFIALHHSMLNCDPIQ